MVLDGIASGTVWIDMEELGVDAFITGASEVCASCILVGRHERLCEFVCLVVGPSESQSHPRRYTPAALP